MKEKIKNIINDEKKRTILILVIVLIIVLSAIVIALLVVNNKKNDIVETTTTTTTKKKNIFKGYTIEEVDFSSNIKYDYTNKYEFKYASKDGEYMIYTLNEDKELYYETHLKDGVLSFTEETYDAKKKTYMPTGKKYQTDGAIKYSSYIVASTCQKDDYSIALMDDKNNVYVFNSVDVEELTIDNIINNLEVVKTSNKVTKVGYYDLSKEPGSECNEYMLIYLDNNNLVRKLDESNSKFFESAYYRYIGSRDADKSIYVLKDGLMKYGSNNKNINDGNYNIYYRGSFYTETSTINDVYIISKEGYLYKIANINSSETSNVIKRYSNSKISKIGTRVVKNEASFATDKYSIVIEFEDESNLILESISEFELLR